MPIVLDELHVVKPGGIQVIPIEDVQVDTGVIAVGGGIAVVGVDDYVAELPVGDIGVKIMSDPANRGAACVCRIVNDGGGDTKFPAWDAVPFRPAA